MNKQAEIASREQMERDRLALEYRKMELDAELRRMESETQVAVATANAQAKPDKPEKPEKSEKEEKQPIVVNIQAPPAPNVTVEPPVVNIAAPKRGKRKAKITGEDGSSYTVESDGE